MKLIEGGLITRRGRLKDEVDKSRVSQESAKLTWLDHVHLVIYRSYDHNITPNLYIYPILIKNYWLIINNKSR